MRRIALFVLDNSHRLLAVGGLLIIGGGLVWLEFSESYFGRPGATIVEQVDREEPTNDVPEHSSDYRLPDTKISYDVHKKEAGSVYHFQIEAVQSNSVMTDACLSNLKKEGKRIKIDYPGLQRSVSVFWRSDGKISVEKTDTTGKIILGEDASKIKRLSMVLDQVVLSYERRAVIEPTLLHLLFAEGRDSSVFWTWQKVSPRTRPAPPANRDRTFTATHINSRKPARTTVAQAFKPASSSYDERVLFFAFDHMTIMSYDSTQLLRR